MPPKLNDGGFVPFCEALFFTTESGQTIRLDGVHEITEVTDGPVKYGFDPIDIGQHGQFTLEIGISNAQGRRIRKAVHAAVNRQNRAIRTEKRQREKERRRMLKEANNG